MCQNFKMIEYVPKLKKMVEYMPGRLKMVGKATCRNFKR